MASAPSVPTAGSCKAERFAILWQRSRTTSSLLCRPAVLQVDLAAPAGSASSEPPHPLIPRAAPPPPKERRGAEGDADVTGQAVAATGAAGEAFGPEQTACDSRGRERQPHSGIGARVARLESEAAPRERRLAELEEGIRTRDAASHRSHDQQAVESALRGSPVQGTSTAKAGQELVLVKKEKQEASQDGEA